MVYCVRHCASTVDDVVARYHSTRVTTSIRCQVLRKSPDTPPVNFRRYIQMVAPAPTCRTAGPWAWVGARTNRVSPGGPVWRRRGPRGPDAPPAVVPARCRWRPETRCPPSNPRAPGPSWIHGRKYWQAVELGGQSWGLDTPGRSASGSRGEDPPPQDAPTRTQTPHPGLCRYPLNATALLQILQKHRLEWPCLDELTGLFYALPSDQWSSGSVQPKVRVTALRHWLYPVSLSSWEVWDCHRRSSR